MDIDTLLLTIVIVVMVLFAAGQIAVWVGQAIRRPVLTAQQIESLQHYALVVVQAVRQLYGRPGEKLTADELLDEARQRMSVFCAGYMPEIALSVIDALLEWAVGEMKRELGEQAAG